MSVAFAKPAGLFLAAATFAFVGCQLAENLAGNLAERLFSNSERTGKLVDGKHEGEWTFKYESGAPKAKGRYEHDHQVGRWKYWYENGNVEWEGGFEDRVSGPTYFGYENGKRRAIGYFADGLEEGLWTFWSSEGPLSCEGDFVRGQPSLRWTYYHPSGTPRAEGYRLLGERVGPWQFYDAAGGLSERRFPMPEGTQIVHELWVDSIPRREGFLADGLQNGRWVTSHPNGRRRITADFVDGQLHGLLLAWTDVGEPVARGHMERGEAVGEWELWRNGVPEKVPGAGIDLSGATFETWSRQGNPGARSPERTVAMWLSEVMSTPFETIDFAPDPNIPSPSSDAVTATDSVPSIPLRPQPWTVREMDSLEFLVARYTDGATGMQAPRSSGYGRRGGRNLRTAEQGGDPVLSAKFLGTELPWTRFYEANGNVVDMDDYRSRSKVVLVVLRGFAREVCVYCVTQTEALCDSVEEFKKLNCEVFVVYPGERNRLEVFMESFKKVSKHMGEPPIGVLYDRNMELVSRMGIASEFAIPSTFVLDESGVIRYSYVGEDIDDRPAANDVLEAIKGMATP